MNKEKGKMETKISNLTTKLSQMSATLEEEQQLNRSLTQNQVRWWFLEREGMGNGLFITLVPKVL